jgi:asparagine synthase (glutamine-hydrolysing)
MKEEVNTFTISTDGSWCDESEEAALTAEYLKTKHHVFSVKPDFVEISAKLAEHYGQPFADHSSVMTYYVSRETRKYATVALSGDGGDELFGGYNSYLNSAKYAFLGRLPSPIKQAHALLLRNSQQGLKDSLLAAAPLPRKGENISTLFHFYWREKAFNTEFKKEIELAAEEETELFTRYFEEAESENPLDRWMEVDQRMYLADDILAKVDIASMAVSLECRAPFLDHHLAEFANKISSTVKLKGGKTKYLLKLLAEKQLPAGISGRSKKGFSMPMNEWLRGDLKDWAYGQIFDNKATWLPYLNEEAVKNFWSEHQKEKFDHSGRLWQIISLNLSLRK